MEKQRVDKETMAQAVATEVVKAEVSTYSDLQSADGHKYTVYNITVTDAADEGAHTGC